MWQVGECEEDDEDHDGGYGQRDETASEKRVVFGVGEEVVDAFERVEGGGGDDGFDGFEGTRSWTSWFGHVRGIHSGLET